MSTIQKKNEPKSSGEKSRDLRPTHVLPTNRIAFPKQIDILRAFGAASEPDGHAVGNPDVAGIVNMSASTISLLNAFFLDIQMLQKTGDGFIPSPDVIEFTRMSAWNPETAPQRLSPIIQRSWFAQALLPKLRHHAIPESEAIETLASTATAAPAYRPQLGTLLEYLQMTGIIERENGQLRLLHSNNIEQLPSRTESPATPPPEIKDPLVGKHPPVQTAFSSSPTAGLVQFNISVKVDMQEIRNWKPERITAFFAGIAQVLAAKGTVEEMSATPQ